MDAQPASPKPRARPPPQSTPRTDPDNDSGFNSYMSELSGYWNAVASARDWVGTSQPWTRFVGWQGWGNEGALGAFEQLQASWNVPTAEELGPRFSQNMTHYLTNYAVTAAIALVYVVFTHLTLLIWLATLAVLYFGSQWLWNNRHFIAQRLGLPLPRFQLPLKPQHSTLLFSLVGAALVFYVIGHDVFVFVGITSTLVLSHAAFRTPLSETPGGKKMTGLHLGGNGDGMSVESQANDDDDGVGDERTPQAV